MTAPTTALGRNTVFKLDNAAGGLVVLTNYEAAVSMKRSIETDGDTTKGKRYESSTKGMVEPGSISGSGPSNPTLLRHMAGIWGMTATVTAEVDPAGTATGRRMITAETILTSIELSCDQGATNQLSTEHKVSGDWTFAANP